MKALLSVSIAAVLFAATANANVGVFSGSGATIELIKSNQVQLVSEEVTISPRCGLMSELDTVEYRCKFVLKNLAKEPVLVHVGFPLDRGVLGSTNPDATDMVMSYHFIARDATNTYHVQYIWGGGDTSKYNELFLWDMAFAAGETRTLQVGYVLPVSYAGTKTLKDIDESHLLNLRHEKPWHARLEGCFLEHFHYITETGRSWAGPIEKATFRVETTGLEACFDLRTKSTSPDAANFATVMTSDPAAMHKAEMSHLPPETTLSTSIYRQISPEGWKLDSEHGITAWKFRNFKPGPPLHFYYYFVLIPREAPDCDTWVKHLLGDKPRKGDVLELREIVAAFYGIAPQGESALRFAEKQIWYRAKKELRESQLSEKQRAVLDHLAAKAKDRE